MKNLVFLFAAFILSVQNIWAQGCSVCTQTANNLGEKGADGLNNGIIYLAFLPLTIMFVIGYVWWKYNRRANG